MQVRAIIGAAVHVRAAGITVEPDIMVPLVGSVAELQHQAALIRAAAAEVVAEAVVEIPFRVGVMIETPRAVLRAGAIAADAEFFSFGTNDLTQMTLGMSRDDIGSFLPVYLSQKLLPADPFTVCVCTAPIVLFPERHPAA